MKTRNSAFSSTGKRTTAIITSLVIIGSITYYHHITRSYNKADLILFDKALKDFQKDHNCAKLVARRQAVERYYLYGDYEQDVRHMSAQAWNYFKKLPVTPRSLIIFDIDDTALYHYHAGFEFKFIWQQQPFLSYYREPGKAPVIKPVLQLYKKLVHRGFTIVFLTGRSERERAFTEQELRNAGYTTYKELILMPTELAYDPEKKTADWKYGVRKKLAEQYDIVGNIGDRTVDFEGGYNGYSVKLPNYLY